MTRLKVAGWGALALLVLLAAAFLSMVRVTVRADAPVELLYQARFLGSQVQLGSPILPVAMVVAAIYIAMCLLLSQFAHYLERRTRRTRPGDPAAPADDTAIEMEQVRAGAP